MAICDTKAGNKYFDGIFGKQPGGHAVPDNHINSTFLEPYCNRSQG